MLEYMHNTISVKDGRHGMGYGYFLTKVFKYFEIPLGLGVIGTVKQNIFMDILVKWECLEERTWTKSKVSEMVVEQEQVIHELEEMTAILANKDSKIARLRVELLKAKIEGPGEDELAALKVQNNVLITMNIVLNGRLLSKADDRLTLLLQSVTSKPTLS
ncbi:hypothetical protein KY284_032655 [Solanum tuberosum]|nr:hypothetical protein KY284_032655 [Solanum tuberosum]